MLFPCIVAGERARVKPPDVVRYHSDTALALPVADETSLLQPERMVQITLPRQQFFLAYGAFILIGAHDGAIGALLPNMRSDYALAAATVALLFVSQTIGYLAISFNTGVLIRRLGIRRFLAGGALFFALGSGIVALHPALWVGVLLPYVLIGSGLATLDAGLNAYLASVPNNGAALNYLHACYGGGALLGPLIATGLLTLHATWNLTYGVWALSSVGVAISLWRILRDPIAPTEDAATTTRQMAPWRLRFVAFGALFLLMYVGLEASLGNWGFSLLHQARGVSLLLAGWAISGYWAGLTLGRLVLARRVARVGEVRMITECLFGVFVGIALALALPSGAGNSVAFWLIGFFLGPIFPSMIALTARRVPASMLSGAIGFLASLGITGAALFPWLAGNVIQRAGLVALLPFDLALTLAIGLAWLAVQRAPRVA